MPPPTMTTLASLGRLEFTMGREFTCETFFHNAPFRGQRVRGATWHYHHIESGLQDFRRPLTLALSPSDGERVAFRPGAGIRASHQLGGGVELRQSDAGRSKNFLGKRFTLCTLKFAR